MLELDYRIANILNVYKQMYIGFDTVVIRVVLCMRIYGFFIIIHIVDNTV